MPTVSGSILRRRVRGCAHQQEGQLVDTKRNKPSTSLRYASHRAAGLVPNTAPMQHPHLAHAHSHLEVGVETRHRAFRHIPLTGIAPPLQLPVRAARKSEHTAKYRPHLAPEARKPGATHHALPGPRLLACRAFIRCVQTVGSSAWCHRRPVHRLVAPCVEQGARGRWC